MQPVGLRLTRWARRPHPRRRDVAERDRENIELAVDDPVVVRDKPLRGDLALVEAQMSRAHGERPDGQLTAESTTAGSNMSASMMS